MTTLTALRAREEELAREWQWLNDAINTVARAKAERGDVTAFRLMQAQVMRIGQRRVELQIAMAELERRSPAVVRRKGELTKKQIDREWPHQVALPTPIPHVMDMHDFCRQEGLSLCQRTVGFNREVGREVIWYTCFCFADRVDAERFRARFGGEFHGSEGPSEVARRQPSSAVGGRPYTV